MNEYIFDHDNQALNLSKEQVESTFVLKFKGKYIIVEVVKSQNCTNCIFNDRSDCICKEKGINCLSERIKYIRKDKDMEDRLTFKEKEQLWMILGRLDGVIFVMEQKELRETHQAFISNLKETRRRLEKIIDEITGYENK